MKPLIALLALLTAQTVRGADLVIATTPDGQAEPITLTLVPGSSTGTFVLYLRNTTAKPLDGVFLLAGLTDAQKQPLPGVSVDFLKPGSEKPETSWTAPPHEPVRFVLRVSNLAPPGTFSGSIWWQKTPGIEPLASLRIVRPPKPTLKIHEADDSHAIKRTITGRQFNLPLTVSMTSQSDQVDVADLRVTYGKLARKDGVRGLEATWDQDPDGKPQTVRVGGKTILLLHGKLPERATYTGWLSLQYGAQSDDYSLELTRAVSPGLAVVDFPDGKLAFQVGSQACSLKVTLQAADGYPDIGDLKIAVDALTRLDGKPAHSAKLTPELASAAIRAGDTLQLVLTGEKLEATSYRSVLRLSYDGVTQALPITLSRAALLANLSMEEPGTSATTLRVIPSWALPATVSVTVKETLGQDTTIYLPHLDGLQLVDKDGKAVRIGGKQIQLKQRDAAGALDDVKDAKQLPTLPGGGELIYELHLRDLGPGAYHGKVAVSGPDSAEVAKTFVVNVRGPALCAFLVILIGGGLSIYLYTWIRDGRFRALRSVAVAVARRSFQNEYQKHPEDPVWSYFWSRLDELDSDNTLEKLDNTKLQNDVNGIKARGETYRQALSGKARIDELLQSLPDGPRKGFQEKLAVKMGSIQRALLEPAGDATTLVPGLQTLFEEIRQSTIAGPAAELEQRIQTFADECIEFPALTKKIDALTQQVHALREPGDHPPSFAELSETLQRARRAYASLRADQLIELIEKLRLQMKSAKTVPAGEWKEVNRFLEQAELQSKNTKKAAGSLEAALAAWQEGHNQHLRALIEYLAALAKRQTRPTYADAAAWNTARQEFNGYLEEARRRWEDKAYDAADAARQKAEEANLKILFLALRAEFAHALDLVEKMPDCLRELWNLNHFDQQKTAEDKLRPIRAELVDVEEPFQDRRARYRHALTDVISMKLEVLGGLCACFEAYANKEKDFAARFKNSPGETDLSNLKRALEEAKADLDAALDPKRREPEALSLLNQAVDCAAMAETGYGRLLQLIEGGGAMSYDKTKPMPDQAPPSFPSMVEFFSWKLPAVARIAKAPDQGLLANLAPFHAPKNTVEVLLEKIQSRDTSIQVLVLIVGAVAGFGTLWVMNPTFGSLQDYIGAFLWGFGIQSATSFITIATTLGAVQEKT